MTEITYKPIGIIHTPFKEPRGTPIQPAAARGIRGTVEIFPEYVEGLKDVDGFSYIYLLFHFHLSKPHRLKGKPYLDTEERGIFAIRGPSRPNPIGLSIVHLVGIQGNILHIKDVDMIDGTPLLDIKPYIPEFDDRKDAKIGWLEKRIQGLPEAKDDGRFTQKR